MLMTVAGHRLEIEVFIVEDFQILSEHILTGIKGGCVMFGHKECTPSFIQVSYDVSVKSSKCDCACINEHFRLIDIPNTDEWQNLLLIFVS